MGNVCAENAKPHCTACNCISCTAALHILLFTWLDIRRIKRTRFVQYFPIRTRHKHLRLNMIRITLTKLTTMKISRYLVVAVFAFVYPFSPSIADVKDELASDPAVVIYEHADGSGEEIIDTETGVKVDSTFWESTESEDSGRINLKSLDAIEANPHAQKFYNMYLEEGGMKKWNKKIKGLKPAKLKQMYKKYGINYFSYEDLKNLEKNNSKNKSSSDVSVRRADIGNSNSAWDCVNYFTGSIRNSTVQINPVTAVSIDGNGRPFAAAITWWPGMPSYSQLNVSSACAELIRDLGVSGDQAGHLIPKRLGGYNKRANLAPQNGTLNQGKWRSQLEAGIAECHSRRNNGLFRVTVKRFFGLITTTELGTLNSATYTAIANYGSGGRPIGYTPTIISSFTVPSGQAGLDTIITVPNTAFANTSNTLGSMKSIIVDKHCKQ